MKRILFIILPILLNLPVINAQVTRPVYLETGNTQATAIDLGSKSGLFSYTDTKNTADYTNNYTGQPSNDVYYRFTLTSAMDITISHCGSEVNDTYVHLLNASGAKITSNDDYSGDGKCSSTYQSYLKMTNLAAGTYYVVSEGYSQNGNITTNIQGGPNRVEYDLGTKSGSFTYTHTQNTASCPNSYTGRPANDVFYRFTTTVPMDVVISHCGSSVSDTYVHLLNASGGIVNSNDDYSGEGKCSSTLHSYLKVTSLAPGTYYVISEGYSQNGNITTQVSATAVNVQGDTFQNPITAGTYNGSFQYSDTKNTANFTNRHTARAPNDVYYRFTLGRKMLVTMTHCGSALSDTYMYLLDASGNQITLCDDYLGDGACPSTLHSFIQRQLDAGTYYVVSEGYSQSGNITTNITGYAPEDFDYPDIPNTYSSDPDAVGSVSGSLNISPTGGAVYSIPIDVPQGVNGLQPTLSITYNSQTGNGLAGWGCNLSGLSVITRAPKDIYHDGTAKGITHLADEAYMLDGQRLVYTSGTPGQDGAVYYPESDPFTKVIVHGTYNTTTAGSWFEVQSSDGMKYYYGGFNSGRQNYTVGSSPRIHAWYLNYAEDPSGNTIMYSYYNYGNFFYPETITYGDNKDESGTLENTIRFEYEYRNDITPFVIEGVKGQMSWRLKAITSRTAGSTYRRYELQYNDTGDGTGTKYSRLASVTEKNAAGEILKPLRLDWQYLPAFYQSASTVTVRNSYPDVTHKDQKFSSVDINGDGLTDLVGVYSYRYMLGQAWEDRCYAYIYRASLNTNGALQFTTGQEYHLGSADFQIGDWTEQRGGAFSLDFNGDGVNDLLIPNVSIIRSVNYKAVQFKFAGGFFNGQSITYPLRASDEMPLYTTGDMNNDGKGDIIIMERGQSNGRYPFTVIGHNSGTTIYNATFDLSLAATPEKLFVSDFNGDGLQDVIVFRDGGYAIFWNQGNGITTSTFSDSKKTTGTNIGAGFWTMIRSGDFNGDGLMDFLINDTGSSSWYFGMNNGDGTFTKSLACTLSIYDQDSTSRDDDKFDCHVYDFDGDGKSDVVITKAMLNLFQILSKTYTYWMRSTGSALTQVASATSNREEDALSSRFVLGDFDGDGQPELMNYGYNCYSSTNANADPVWRLYRNPNLSAASGKVSRVTDGYGAATYISYASLTDGGIYTKGTGSSYPVADYAVPLHAVRSVMESDGITGNITTGYQYKGLKVHLQGRGMLGMTSQTATNTRLGTVTESGIKAWNTSFYVPSQTYTKTTVDGKTAETNVTMAVADKGSKKYFAYPSTKTEKDLDGNTVTTTYRFNTTYGYMTEEKADFGGNMYKTVQYGNYILAGRSYKPQLVTAIQKHSDDASTFTQKTAYTYNTAKGHKTQAIENQGSSLPLTTDYTYDTFGNVLTSKATGSGITPVTSYYNYDPTKRFVVKTYTSPASVVNTFTYDRWGNILTEKDETNASDILTTTHTYDTWGNRIMTVYPDGQKATVKRGWNNNSSKRYFVLTQGTGQPWVKTWYDNRGREVLVESIGEKGMAVRQATSYSS
ncbi:MAG: FG-GAP-like repeat-containing protein, partial [Prevotella sp.]|nr:FG-GAP-like repeat-containing protein [Prevotella sp.]